MNTRSPGPGTCCGDQFVAAFQNPPEVFIQTMSAPRNCKTPNVSSKKDNNEAEKSRWSFIKFVSNKGGRLRLCWMRRPGKVPLATASFSLSPRGCSVQGNFPKTSGPGTIRHLPEHGNKPGIAFYQ